MSTQKVFGFDVGIKVEEKVTRWVAILMGELVVVALVAWLLLIPRVQEVIRVREELSVQQKLAQDLERKVSMIETFAVEFAGSDQLMNNVFMSSKDTPALLAMVRDIAVRAGMSISGYRIAATKLEEPEAVGGRGAVSVVPIEVEITIGGPTGQVNELLRLLDESLPIKRVTNLEIGKSTPENLELKMKIAAYVFPAAVKPNALGLVKPFTAENRALFERIQTFYQPQLTQPEETILGNPNFFGL